MNYLTFDPSLPGAYEIAFLVPQLNGPEMAREYLGPGVLDPIDVIAYELHLTGKKTPATAMRAYLDDLLPILKSLEVKYLMVGDVDYFKVLTGVNKAEAYLGYALSSVWPSHMHGEFQVLYVPKISQIFHNPGPTRAKIKQAFDALWSHRVGRYRDPGCDIISVATYPTEVADIAAWLQRLIDRNMPLTADIEAFSLKHYDAGIGTIAFAWSKHEGIAFPVDLGPDPPAVRKLLRRFFREFRNKLLWHRITFDVTVLISQLYMENICDTEGLLEGLEVMLKPDAWDCTRLISYLATNSCAGNELGLKAQAQEFAGNYAVEEIENIARIPLPQLLQYNLVDCLSTWFVYEKNWPKLIADDQLEIYKTIFRPAVADMVQMQLTGLPVDMDQVALAKEQLEKDRIKVLARIQAHRLVREMTHILNEDWVATRNAELKKKQIKLGDEPQVFNPNSGPQMQQLLYEVAELPVINLTQSGQPGTGKKVLQKLKAHTEEGPAGQSVRDLLDAFLDFAAVDKILSAFIPAMEGAVLGPDGVHYLFGNFNLGGTVSGRLSSSDPNLQTIPANSRYAKLIKRCFVAPKGWLFVGVDFNALEDKISALTTRDPQKLRVYEDGFDGHSLRAQTYFPEAMPDVETAPEGARCFEARIGDKPIWFHEHELVTYLGQEMTGLELWERLANVRTPT